MIELPIIIESELRGGLRPQAQGRAGINSPFLLNLEGVRVGQLGLEPLELAQDPFLGLVPVDWPFPQLFRGDDISLLARRNRVDIVTEAANMWSTSSLTLSDTSSPSTSKAVTEGGVWHHADMGGSWYLFNGNCTLFTTGLDSLVPQDQKYWINDSVTIKTGCTHKSRVVVGGFSSTDIFSATMSDIFRELQSMTVEDWVTSFDDIGQNYILWGSIGGGDFPLWLFMPLQYPQTFRPTLDRFIERLKRNQFGWAPCTFRGTVQVLKPLGDHLIAYGTDGVTAFTHFAGDGDVPATYGHRSPGQAILNGLGVYDRGSVVGNDSIHYWIDPTGNLWSLDSNLSLSNLGYQEYFKEFVDNGESVVGSFDPIESDFYFSSNERSLVISETGAISRGLYKYPYLTSWAGKKYGSEKGAGDLAGLFASLETNAFDQRDRNRKTITSVNVGARGGGTLEVALRYKYSTDGAWELSEWEPVNPEGNATIRVHALEHRLLLRASDPSTFELEYILVKVQRDDRRFRRGPTEGSRIAREIS